LEARMYPAPAPLKSVERRPTNRVPDCASLIFSEGGAVGATFQTNGCMMPVPDTWEVNVIPPLDPPMAVTMNTEALVAAEITPKV